MTSKVYVALRVKATPERAFQAFVEEIGAWWRPSALFETTPRPGVLSFEPGKGGRLIETRAGVKFPSKPTIPEISNIELLQLEIDTYL